MSAREKRLTFRFTQTGATMLRRYTTGDTATLRIVFEPGEIHAIWGDGDPYAMDADAEVLAQARRFYRSQGANFSGWIVECGQDYSNPIRDKSNAESQLLDAVADELGGAWVPAAKGKTGSAL
ncbi:hypothetical protein GCM10012275_64550 [Longimycelium tulufanense]|uniref:Uncharacterized protein n=1 Tax=Longimycelium tulufanense TaxID=907463 RepID=A0A8J3CF48_9PSEU|nr:hypothetical protein [Longimycelium tulufanense]GGM84890.1 hypothetical protein GCM10012275_64550 [Longimycelium tulufanense]